MDTLRVEAEIGKLMAETVKLNAEAAKMIRERLWYPAIVLTFVAGAAASIVAVALTKLLQ